MATRLTALALFVANLLALTQAQCPAGFTFDSSSIMCYAVSASQTGHDQAVTNCQRLGATLPIIHNDNFENLVERIAAQNRPNAVWYIGLTRTAGNQFTWQDNSLVDYTKWKNGQPGAGTGQDCVVVDPGATRGWQVSSCTALRPFICVVPASTTTTSTTINTADTTPGRSTTTQPDDPNTCRPSQYGPPSGVLVSPGFLSNQNYANNLNCFYYVTVQSNYFVLLTVNSFATEQCCDQLKIYDGSDASGTPTATWAGRLAAGTQYESSGNQLAAQFSTDASVTDVGFSIQYSQTQATLPPPTTPTCPASNYSGPTGAIQSPGYPGNYDNNMDCHYYITVASNLAVNLTFDFFQTESCCDFVNIFDGANASANVIATVSGTDGRGQSYVRSQNVMHVRFTTDSSVVDRGFHATWTQVTPPTTPPPPTINPPTDPSPECGADFTLDPASNRCYHYDYSLKTFDDANAACQNLSAQLVSIHNQALEDFLTNYIRNSAGQLNGWLTWIGLQTTGAQFTQWTDGTQVDYSSWEPGQPDLNVGNCGAFQAWTQPGKDNGWRTVPCSYQRRYVCARARIA